MLNQLAILSKMIQANFDLRKPSSLDQKFNLRKIYVANLKIGTDKNTNAGEFAPPFPFNLRAI